MSHLRCSFSLQCANALMIMNLIENVCLNIYMHFITDLGLINIFISFFDMCFISVVCMVSIWQLPPLLLKNSAKFCLDEIVLLFNEPIWNLLFKKSYLKLPFHWKNSTITNSSCNLYLLVNLFEIKIFGRKCFDTASTVQWLFIKTSKLLVESCYL